MAKFSQTFLQGLLQPTYQQGLFEAARNVGQTPALMREQEQRQQRERGMMGGMLAAQQAAAEGRFDPETMKSYIGSMQGLGVSQADIMQTLPTLQQANQAGVLNNNQNQLVGLQQQLNEQANILLQSDDQSRKEAANFQIDSLEEQMVNIAKETRGIDASTLVGAGDRARASVTEAQLKQIETDAQISGAKQKLARASLEQLRFGTEGSEDRQAWNAKAKQLEDAGYQKVVQDVRTAQQEIELANETHKNNMADAKAPSEAQLQEMKKEGLKIPEDRLQQRQLWRTFSETNRQKQVDNATAYLDPVKADQAEGLVSYYMNRIAASGDYFDITSDDITEVIGNLNDEQKAEVADLVVGKTTEQVGVVIEKWLKENYPGPFARSAAYADRMEAERNRENAAVLLILEANPQLDPNDPTDRQTALDRGREIAQEEREKPFRDRRDSAGFGR